MSEARIAINGRSISYGMLETNLANQENPEHMSVPHLVLEQIFHFGQWMFFLNKKTRIQPTMSEPFCVRPVQVIQEQDVHPNVSQNQYKMV